MAPIRVVPAATPIEVELIKGDSSELTVPVLDAANQPVDVTGWTGLSQIRRSETEPVLHEWSAAAANIHLTSAGVVLDVDGTVTSLWAWRDAHISVEVTGPDGKPHTIAYGTVRALPQYTRA